MANNEDYLDALTAFSRNTSREIPPILEQYLNGVAKNGETMFQWSLLKPLIVGKMEQVIEELRQGLSSENIPQRPNVENVRFEVMQARIMDALHKFNGAPFTIQRLCELLVDPKRHYKRSDKFMRGLEKNVLVVSTVDPYGRKVVSESGTKHLVNGMDTNGSPFFPRDSNISSNLPPVPGWVTTTVTMATHAQNTPEVTSEQKPAQQNSTQDSPVTTSSSTSLALVSSLYADQGEQPPTVHAEEVVEETVVTMDTNEAGSVAVDGGEAMAVDAEEEEMGGDDTNASSSSSSSTSSEELSTPDTGESVASVEDRTMTVSSSSQVRTRPWASIASEGEDKRETASSSADLCPSPATDYTETSEPLPAADNSPDSPSNKQVDHPSSSDTSSTQPEPTLADNEDVANSIAEPVTTESLPDTLPEPEKVLDSSFGFTESTSTSSEAVTEPQDSQSSEPSIDDSANVASGSPESSTTGSDEFIPSSAATDNTQTSPAHSYEPSSSSSSSNTTDSHAEVSASSSTDSQPRDDISSDISTDECDSVAGLERLVDSVDEPSSVSSGSPKSACSLSAEASHKTEQSDSSPMSSSLDSSMNSDEPQAKQRRLSDDSSSSLLSSTEAATSESVSSEADASSSSKTDSVADTTSDSTCEASAPPSAWNQNSNDQESHEMVVSCSGSGSESAASGELQDQEKDTSPVSPKSSEDSLGFGDFEGAATENLVGEKQTEELVKDEAEQEECGDKSALPEHEAMDQD